MLYEGTHVGIGSVSLLDRGHLSRGKFKFRPERSLRIGEGDCAVQQEVRMEKASEAPTKARARIGRRLCVRGAVTRSALVHSSGAELAV